MTDDFALFLQSDHWLGLDWIGDDPARSVRAELERMFRNQAPSCSLTWIRIVSKPYFFAGMRTLSGNAKQAAATHAAFAVSFELEVMNDERVDHVRGAFSWVAIVEGERAERVYMDIDMELLRAYDLLKVRVLDLDPIRFSQTSEWIVEQLPIAAEPPKRSPWWKFGRA